MWMTHTCISPPRHRADRDRHHLHRSDPAGPAVLHAVRDPDLRGHRQLAATAPTAHCRVDIRTVTQGGNNVNIQWIVGDCDCV